MGGILIKEMLVKSMQPGAPAAHQQLQRQTRGLAFYATPHHGSWLADVGWNLRFLGASPAASVLHLKRGPQQEVLPRLLPCWAGLWLHVEYQVASCSALKSSTLHPWAAIAQSGMRCLMRHSPQMCCPES